MVMLYFAHDGHEPHEAASQNGQLAIIITVVTLMIIAGIGLYLKFNRKK